MKLKGVVQHYAWGGKNYISKLLSINNAEYKPYAEYWMGAHVKAPSLIKSGNMELPLDKVISESPASYLGKKVADKFGNRLPYLFKILDVKDMLSIQVHPTKQAAEKGFAKENKEGIPLTASYRNYKDDNHKPEIMVALTEFWLIHGFKSSAEITRLFQETPEFKPLAPYFENGGYEGLYKYVMELPQQEIDLMLDPLINRLVPLYQADQLSKASPDFWAARAALQNQTAEGSYDRGIFSIYFFNLVHAQPGEGIFQGAGVPHAYLEGVNVELMANSDNVLRGGLTPKYIDVPELLSNLKFEPVTPKILSGAMVSETERVYKSPAADFEVSCIQVTGNQSYQSSQDHAIDIAIVLKGEVEVVAATTNLTLRKGEVFMAAAHTLYAITTEKKATLYKATVPVN